MERISSFDTMTPKPGIIWILLNSFKQLKGLAFGLLLRCLSVALCVKGHQGKFVSGRWTTILDIEFCDPIESHERWLSRLIYSCIYKCSQQLSDLL
jgi:hypothetical protein